MVGQLCVWLQNDDFKVEYRSAKREAVAQAVTRLQQVAAEAVDTLREVMVKPESKDSARVTAAKTVLELAVKGIELEDLSARVEQLEKLSKERGE